MARSSPFFLFSIWAGIFLLGVLLAISPVNARAHSILLSESVTARSFDCILAGGTRTQILGFHFNLEALVPYCSLNDSTFLYADGLQDACEKWSRNETPASNTRRWNADKKAHDYEFAFPGLDITLLSQDSAQCAQALTSDRYQASNLESLQHSIEKLRHSQSDRPVLISWSTHGAPDGALSLVEGALSLTEHQNLLRDLRAALPAHRALHLVTGACFSGQLARLFYDLPNACAWFEVDEYELNYGDENDLHVQLKTVALDRNNDGKLSLAELTQTAQTEPFRTSDYFAKDWLLLHESEIGLSTHQQPLPYSETWLGRTQALTETLLATTADWDSAELSDFWTFYAEGVSATQAYLAQGTLKSERKRRHRAQWLKALRLLHLRDAIEKMHLQADHAALEQLDAFLECEERGLFQLSIKDESRVEAQPDLDADRSRERFQKGCEAAHTQPRYHGRAKFEPCT